MERIGVFCAAREHIAPVFRERTVELGRWLGANKKTIVYGGCRCGLMEELARAVKAAGGRCLGVVPRIVSERNLESDCIDVEFRCENLSDRKDILLRESDILIALPGGVGTLDEVFSVVASNFIGYHAKKVVLYNIEGYWNPLLDTLEKMKTAGFIDADLGERLLVANSMEEIERLLS